MVPFGPIQLLAVENRRSCCERRPAKRCGTYRDLAADFDGRDDHNLYLTTRQRISFQCQPNRCCQHKSDRQFWRGHSACFLPVPEFLHTGKLKLPIWTVCVEGRTAVVGGPAAAEPSEAIEFCGLVIDPEGQAQPESGIRLSQAVALRESPVLRAKPEFLDHSIGRIGNAR